MERTTIIFLLDDTTKALKIKFFGNRKAGSEFLEQFMDEADGGYITNVSAIKAAHDEKVGHETGHGQTYNVLLHSGHLFLGQVRCDLFNTSLRSCFHKGRELW